MADFVNVESIENDDTLKVKSNTSLFAENFYFSEVLSPKLYKKFITNTERLIRSSKEYDEYIADLRSNIAELNSDNILSHVTGDDVKLEFHHYPFSLYDIVDIVASHKIQNDINFTSFSLAKEIMNLHFQNKIGLVSLSHTTHELAHNGFLFLSTDQIFGDWRSFMKLYKDGISSDLAGKIDQLETRSKKDIPSDFTGIFE